MNKKISLPELADLICDTSGLTKKETEAFLNDLFDVIEEHLYSDKQVKIKGLGTFKLVTVEERKSVDINTGQPIVIPAHSKVTFAPDAELKALVNKPYESLEPVFLDDVKEEELEPFAFEEVPIEESDQEEEISLSEAEKELLSDRQQIDQSPVALEENSPSSDRKTYHGLAFWSGLLVGITLVCAIAFLAWNRGMLNLSPNETTVDMVRDHLIKEASQPVLSDSLSHLLVDQQEETLNSAPKDQQEETPATRIPKTAPSTPKVKSKILATEVIGEGTTLSSISKKYYGNKVFWVYLFQANADRVQNPNHIPIGTKIIVPEPDIALIDNDNASTIAKAKELQDQYNRQYR